MGIDALVSDGIPIIFAIDQNAFFTYGNRFCVLCPLMTLSGERFDSRDKDFPNRGRVWWMLRDNIDEAFVKIGTVWSGYPERAVKFDEENPQDDKYQVQRRNIQRGHPDFVEVLDLPVASPPMDDILGSMGLGWPRPVLNRVVLRGKKDTIGILKAGWSQDGFIRLEALNAGKPEALKISTAAFDRIARVERFDFEGNCFDPNEPPVRVELALAQEKWLDIPALRKEGEVIDFATDAQVLNWGLKLLGFTRSQIREVRELNTRLSDENRELVVEEKMRIRLARFRCLAAEMSSIAGAGEEAIETAVASEAFKELIDNNVERITDSRVEAEVKRFTEK